MDDEPDLHFGSTFGGPLPAHLTLSPFSPSPRRLSSCFVDRNRPLHVVRRLARVSLQGRLVDAEEASSARTINGGLAPAETAAWELFSPVQRFLVVAVIGVAVAESKKNAQICCLRKAVQLRDQILSTMQTKLDCLCEELNKVKDNSGINRGLNLQDHEFFGFEKPKFDDFSHDPLNKSEGNCVTKATAEDSILRHKTCLTNFAEQEERRMSDLSDWASSVASATEIQMNNLAVEQDIYNLKRDCEDKDTIIKDLTILLHSSDQAGSKRISELEDIIKRKNTTITRLKKDVVILEQKVMNFARLMRPSFSSSPKPQPVVRVPHMNDNLLFDMDSSTSPSSSSDSDRSKSPISKTPEIRQTFESNSTRNTTKPMPPKFTPVMRAKERQLKSRSPSPLKEISVNQKSDIVSGSSPPTQQRQSSTSSDSKSRRRVRLSTQKDSSTSQKRWV